MQILWPEAAAHEYVFSFLFSLVVVCGKKKLRVHFNLKSNYVRFRCGEWSGDIGPLVRRSPENCYSRNKEKKIGGVSTLTNTWFC